MAQKEGNSILVRVAKLLRLSIYLKHQLSAASELSPNKYKLLVGFNHVPKYLTRLWDSQANVSCFNILHCPYSVGKMCGIRYTKANMAV